MLLCWTHLQARTSCAPQNLLTLPQLLHSLAAAHIRLCWYLIYVLPDFLTLSHFPAFWEWCSIIGPCTGPLPPVPPVHSPLISAYSSSGSEGCWVTGSSPGNHTTHAQLGTTLIYFKSYLCIWTSCTLRNSHIVGIKVLQKRPPPALRTWNDSIFKICHVKTWTRRQLLNPGGACVRNYNRVFLLWNYQTNKSTESRCLVII